MQDLIDLIKKSNSIILSTHTQPDGDGIGSQVALYWALKKIGKEVRIVNVDEIPRKYEFLDSHKMIENFRSLKKPLQKSDLAFIFDTNDSELLLELWPELQTKCGQVIFVDHHPILDRSPIDEKKNIIDTGASSTGQITYNLIKSLGVPLDAQIALPIYTSIVFDTNYFRYIRGSPTPHLIAAELLRHDIEPQKVHRHLFGNHTQNKLRFLAQILGLIEYEFDGRLALVKLKKEDMKRLGVEMDETRDIIDMMMNVETVEAAVLFREDAENFFKLSFRSKGLLTVGHLAQSLGGGGHNFASGAYIRTPYKDIRDKVVKAFEKLFGDLEKKATSG
jgi:bifunctional oligoribonuclease and PAP phosphatase NrnA